MILATDILRQRKAFTCVWPPICPDNGNTCTCFLYLSDLSRRCMYKCLKGTHIPRQGNTFVMLLIYPDKEIHILFYRYAQTRKFLCPPICPDKEILVSTEMPRQGNSCVYRNAQTRKYLCLPICSEKELLVSHYRYTQTRDTCIVLPICPDKKTSGVILLICSDKEMHLQMS